MPRSPSSWWQRCKVPILELFVLSNFAFLVVDIWLAHSVNRFRHPAEWIPFWFSIAAAALLLPAWLRSVRDPGSRFARLAGLAVGYGAVAVGIAGLVYHLESQFFQLWTIQSLVYTAPCIAPLSYAGLGCLLLLDRSVDPKSREWGQWVVFFALGGFVGNFVLALADHAQNGFFHATEWIPVVTSGFAIGFLLLALRERGRAFLLLCLGVLAVQAPVGILGFTLHLRADVNGLAANAFESFVHGAPILAPMLFADLALLGAIGTVDALESGVPHRSLRGHAPCRRERRQSPR